MCCRMIKRSNITKNAVNSTPHNEELTSDVESLLGKKKYLPAACHGVFPDEVHK